MSVTTSVIFRKASKNILSLQEVLHNARFSSIRSTHAKLGKNKLLFSTISRDHQGFLSRDSSTNSRSANFSTSTPKHPDPEPLAAVAYDYDDDDGTDHSSDTINPLTTQDETKISSPGVTSAVKSDVNYVISRRNSNSNCAVKKIVSRENQSLSNNASSSLSSSSKFNPILESIHRASATSTTYNNGGGNGDGNITINAPYPPPSDLEGEVGKTFSKGGGRGGGGRYRCPKCGTFVTFKCDFEDNTFYCASCAGWFAGTRPIDTKQVPSLQQHRNQQSRENEPIYEEYVAKDTRNSRKKGSRDTGIEQEIIMRHVSTRLH